MRFDPEMSEWGNPPREERGTPLMRRAYPGN